MQKSYLRNETFLTATDKKVTIKEIPLSQLYVDGKGIEWNDNNEEVCLEGKFYEIISIVPQHFSAELLLVEDEKENDLFREFFRDGGQENKSALTLAALLFGANFISDHNTAFTGIAGQEVSFSGLQKRIPEGHFSVAEKPPCSVDFQLS